MEPSESRCFPLRPAVDHAQTTALVPGWLGSLLLDAVIKEIGSIPDDVEANISTLSGQFQNVARSTRGQSAMVREFPLVRPLR
jgi:hypothetical protein